MKFLDRYEGLYFVVMHISCYNNLLHTKFLLILILPPILIPNITIAGYLM